MHYSLYKAWRTWGVNALAILLCMFLLPHQCDSYTEVFSITQDADDNTYFVGNRDSDFFIGKKNSVCLLQWESTAGSTSGDDNDNGNSEVLHDAVVGRNGAVYAVGSTHGSFSSPSNEVPNLDAAVVVYDSSTGAVIQQRQYDIAADLDNVAQAISQKANGNILVAVYGSVPNIESIATYETRILEIDSETLEVQNVHEIVVTTTENVFSITGGPKLLDFIYEEATNSIIALGHILGRGILWKYSFDSEAASNQVEWGEAFGNFQISAFTSDGKGAYYVVGSSSEQVLGNSDLQTTVSAEYHAYIVRFDNLDSSNLSPTWVRQLAGSGSSQSGSDVAIDPVTGEIVVIGEYDADFSVTDAQTSQTFNLNLSTDDGITDVFLWYLDASSGDFKQLRSSSAASTNSEDRGNAISILSRRTVQIGGITNDGDDAASTVCDKTNTLPSPTPSSTPSPSVTPSQTPSTSSSPTSSSSPSQTVSPTASSSVLGIPSAASNPSPTRGFLSSASISSSSSSFSSAAGTVEASLSAFEFASASASASSLTSEASPSSLPSPIILQVSASKTPSFSMTSNPSETSESSFAEQPSQTGSLQIFESATDSSQADILASFSESAESSRFPVSSATLSIALDEIAQSNMFIDASVSPNLALEDGLNSIASSAAIPFITDQADSTRSSNEGTSSAVSMGTQDASGTYAEVTNEFEVSTSQEVTSSAELDINIDEPFGNDRDGPILESPVTSSNAILISLLSATPSSTSSPFPSFSSIISPTPILSQNAENIDDPSVSASLFDYSPQSTPQFIPSMTSMFVSVDLGTPTPSWSLRFFTASASGSPRETPSTTFDFIVVDLDVTFSPSTSFLGNAVDVNLPSPTPSLSNIAILVSSGPMTPGLSSEPSPTSENGEDGRDEISFIPSGETPVVSSDPEPSQSEEKLAPNDDGLIAQFSVIPEESTHFSGVITVRSTEASPTSFSETIEPSSTPQPMLTMTETESEEEDKMKSDILSADSGVDEATISPLLMEVGETAVMTPPEASIAMTPLVSVTAKLHIAANSPDIQEIDNTSETELPDDALYISPETPEVTDNILVTMTGIPQFEMSPGITIFDASIAPTSSQPVKSAIVSARDDVDNDEDEDLISSALPSSESIPNEVEETPLFTEEGIIGSVNPQEFTLEETPVVRESPGIIVIESPSLLGSSYEPDLKAFETFKVSEEKLLLADISSSPPSESRFTDFLQSPEPSRALTETMLPSDFSNPFADDASIVFISPDVKNPQGMQTEGNAAEPSTMISSAFFTPLAVSLQATAAIQDTGATSTESNFVQETPSATEASFPNESMEESMGFVNPTETLTSSGAGNVETENLQTSGEDELYITGSSSAVTLPALHTEEEEEDVTGTRAKQSLEPDFTSFTEPMSSYAPSVFVTELASPEIPVASSQFIGDSEGPGILANDPSQEPNLSASTSEAAPTHSLDTTNEFESTATPSPSASSEFTNEQGFTDTGRSPFASSAFTDDQGSSDAGQSPFASSAFTDDQGSSDTGQSPFVSSAFTDEGSTDAGSSLTASSDEFQFTGIAEPETSFVSQQQLVSATPDFSAHVTTKASISSSFEQSSQIPSTSQTTTPVNSYIETSSPSEEPEVEQGSQSNAFAVIETPIPSSEQPFSSSVAPIEATSQPSEKVPFTPLDTTIQASEMPGAVGSEGGLFSQEPGEGPHPEYSATSNEITIIASEVPQPTPTTESLTKATMDASGTPNMGYFTPGIAVSIAEQSPESELSRSPGLASRAATPSVSQSSLVSVSASVIVTPSQSQSNTVEVSTPTTTQSVSREPSFSFIVIVFPSATPSSSPTIRTGTITPSPSPGFVTISKSPVVSPEIPSRSPVLSQGIVPISPSITVGSKSSTPSVSSNPSEAVLIVLPSATPSSSLAVFIVLPSATPSSSLPARGSNAFEPSMTAIESQQGESPSSTATVRFSQTPVKSPEESNFLQSPLVSEGARTSKPSPSSADRGFLTIAPSFQGLETPVVSKTPLPTEPPKPSSSQAPVTSSVPSTTEFSFASTVGSPTILPSRSSQASSSATQSPIPTFSSQPSVLETPAQTPSQNLSTSPFFGTPTREPLASTQPSSIASPIFKPSVSSLPSSIGNMTEFPASPEPTNHEISFSISPGISGNTIGMTSQTFLLEPSPFLSIEISPSAEANFEEPTASLLPTQAEERTPVSSEAAERTEFPAVTEELIVQTPAMSHDIDETKEQASLTPEAVPSFSGEVDISAAPSSLPSQSSTLMASAQPSASLSGDPSPITSVSARSSPSPSSACVGDGSIVVDPGSLNQTRNFQRVNMMIQVAGPNLTGSCHFTGVIAERFILLSAINTLSQADMWHITSIENGPAVFDEESTLVGIEDEDSLQGDQTIVSPSPSNNATKGIRFEGSVIFNVTAFLDSLSVELARGSYVEYINSQNIVKTMAAEGFNDIQWTGMIAAPRVIDVQVQEEDTRVGSGGLTSGEISAVAIGMLLIVGVGAFVIVEGGISTRRSGAILPI